MPEARAGITAAVLDGKLFIFGGSRTQEDPIYCHDQTAGLPTQCYDPLTREWRTLESGATMPKGHVWNSVVAL
jgi:N-acetylneuraminic acid mutarotase